MPVPDVSTTQECLRLLAAAGLGGAIGLERELGAQPAGFRTHVLVAMGASLFTMVGADFVGTDPTRIAAQVVSGIGFLGAGAILREGTNIKGLTTAASLWMAAAAGLACGLGRPLLGAVAIGLSLLTLILLKYLEREFFPRRRGYRVLLEVSDAHDLDGLLHEAEALVGAPLRVRAVSRGASEHTLVTMTSPLQRHFSMTELATRLRSLEGVVGVELDSS